MKARPRLGRRDLPLRALDDAAGLGDRARRRAAVVVAGGRAADPTVRRALRAPALPRHRALGEASEGAVAARPVRNGGHVPAGQILRVAAWTTPLGRVHV